MQLVLMICTLDLRWRASKQALVAEESQSLRCS